MNLLCLKRGDGEKLRKAGGGEGAGGGRVLGAPPRLQRGPVSREEGQGAVLGEFHGKEKYTRDFQVVLLLVLDCKPSSLPFHETFNKAFIFLLMNYEV